jgi:curved DNA-binding protein CbpA
MKIKTYQTMLGLLPDKKYTLEELKKKYKIAALKHHPDKHFNSQESTIKFKEINEAYLYLYGKYDNENNAKQNEYARDENENENDHCYANLLSKFISSLMNKFSNTQIATLHIVIQVLMNKCSILTSTLFDHVDRESLLFIHQLIIKYHSILELGAERLNSIREIIKKKLQENDIIIIQPTISELFNENNIQVVEHEKNIYYVPLWHTEIYYNINRPHENGNHDGVHDKKQKQERELIVKCIPNLPEHIYIDEMNNIYIDVRTRIENLFNQTKLTVLISESVSFDIPVHTLDFKTHQTVTLKKCGIPMINTENMYDVSEKMNIVIHLEILV